MVRQRARRSVAPRARALYLRRAAARCRWRPAPTSPQRSRRRSPYAPRSTSSDAYLFGRFRDRGFRGLETDLRVGPVAEWLLCRCAAPAQRHRAALDDVLATIPVDDANVVSLHDVRTIPAQADCRHSVVTTRQD